jgi:hypothetical protein
MNEMQGNKKRNLTFFEQPKIRAFDRENQPRKKFLKSRTLITRKKATEGRERRLNKGRSTQGRRWKPRNWKKVKNTRIEGKNSKRMKKKKTTHVDQRGRVDQRGWVDDPGTEVGFSGGTRSMTKGGADELKSKRETEIWEKWHTRETLSQQGRIIGEMKNRNSQNGVVSLSFSSYSKRAPHKFPKRRRFVIL